ncbi:MAG: hypothetical protein E7454_07795 [Ruminococcaceae bacterium]|nr:hypothetical protein [Oscillospiraceae bacterium]
MKNSILDLYEDFRLHEGVLQGGDGFFDYRTPASLHSDITSFAYGIAETQSCLSLEHHPCQSEIVLERSDLSRRFYLKLKACLFRFTEYICPITVKVNGRVAYENEREFFETVNLGWPTIYIPVANEFLTAGKNVIEISQGKCGTYLLVAKADLLSLPEIPKNQQLTYCPSVRLGDSFAMAFYVPEGELAVAQARGCEILSIAPSTLDSTHILVQMRATEENPKVTLLADGEEIEVLMPKAYPQSQDVCLVGIDSDDHRHDDTDEANRIISIFANTHLGNFFQARPQLERNYYDLSAPEVWEKRVQYLLRYGTKLSLADSANRMPFFPEMVGADFVGKHFHEAYLYFCSALERDAQMSSELFLDVKKMKSSESFGESKKMFCEALKKMCASSKTEFGRTSVGSPSILASYEASSGFQRVTIEPVSNINLLIGAVRGAKPEMWGAHVPTDWYFGEPNDRTKNKKAMLAMQVLYLLGAQYIYAENSLFKTNAFSREDWDDAFCTQCRIDQREFYDYTIRNPRQGQLQTDLGVIYGNNEFILWHHDDRIAELGENGDWDIKLWGKWENNEHHRCWRAIDAWLPLAEKQHSKKNVLNLDLFSGTPYGPVDIVPYDKDYSEYKAVALLGWNTYEEGFASKIYDYVEKGGTAFVSYCHFNTVDRCDLPKIYAKAAEVEKLLGPIQEEISGEQYSILTCPIADAEKLLTDGAGNALVWKKQIGKGVLYFGTFADYRCPEEKMEAMQQVLRRMGDTTADMICSNPNLCVTQRLQADGSRVVNVLNVCAGSEEAQPYEIQFRDGSKCAGFAAPCTIETTKIPG